MLACAFALSIIPYDPCLFAEGTQPDNLSERGMKILWIEDSEDDVFLFTRAMYRSHPMVAFHHVWSASEAIDYLVGKGKYADRIEFSLPDVILTDLRMPMLSGFQFIQWLRQHPQFHALPVFILSSSGLSSDVALALTLGAVGFFTKPQHEPAWEVLFTSILTTCRKSMQCHASQFSRVPVHRPHSQ